MELAPSTLELLQRYDWPGNVRELENIIQRATALARNAIIYPQDLFMPLLGEDEAIPPLPGENAAGPSKPGLDIQGESCVGEKLQLRSGFSVSEMEKKLILMTLEETGGNRTHAAQLLGISLRTLRNKLREYRLNGVDEKEPE
jgi:two-component system response regulator FlrC